MRKIQLLLALILFSAQASAEWELVYKDEMTNDNEATFYIDKGTIQNQSGYTTMWVLTNYKAPINTGGLMFGSAKVLKFFDCKNLKVGMKTNEFYGEKMGLGTVVYSQSEELDQIKFYDVKPNSVDDILLRAACGTK
jgi:hypothetical protein